MKVLHFGRFYNNSFGGIERQVSLLLPVLGLKNKVANLVAHDHWGYEEVKQPNYPVYKVPSLGLLAGTPICPTMPLVARQLCKSENYEIAHLHFPDPMSHLAAYFLPAHVRLVISWHSDIIKQRNLLRFYRPFLEHISRRADAIVAATPKHFSSSTQIPQSISEDKKHVVPYGIDFSYLDNVQARVQAKKIRQDFEGNQQIFAVGRHVYYKGFEYLIRAMVNLRDTVLLLGGSGPLTESLKQLCAELGLEDRVIFLGRIPDDLLPTYFHSCDVFCMPSVEPSEAFGLVQAEAMACGKPVVCCELGNGVTYVNRHRETGLVVPPRDVCALASALSELLRDEALRLRMGAAANERVRAEFTIEAMTRGMLTIYSQLT